ncbi:hypothetical protein MASR2M64_09640 [Candidatus Cloacimonadota bacterium]
MKKALFIFILLSLIGLAAARYSDQFPLGTYSYLSEKPWFMNNLNALSGAMNQLGYNSTIMETFNPSADLTSIYSRLNADSIDVIISDRSWSNTGGNEKYATTGLTTSSYYKFEAEYKDGGSVTGTDLTDSQYWYGSRNEDMPGSANDINRVGGPFLAVNVTPPASNDYVWRCEPNPDPNILSPGWAYTDLRWRWLTTAGANIRIGKEFILNKYSSDPAQDSLYIKFHLRFYISTSDDLPGNTVLLSFSPVGFQYTYSSDGSVSGHVGIPEPIVHTNGSQTNEVTVLTLDGYLSRFGGKLPTYPFKDIELRISYQELINAGLLLTDGYNRYKLVNLNPRLYYAGHYTLELDYIEIEDKMHRVLMDNYENYDSGVDERITDLSPVSYQDMVKGVYTMDEPFQPQFHSYNKMQEILANNNVKPLTASYDYQYKTFRMVPGEETYYDHLDAFRKLAQPRIIMPDLYPIKPETNWNDES